MIHVKCPSCRSFLSVDSDDVDGDFLCGRQEIQAQCMNCLTRVEFSCRIEELEEDDDDDT